MATKTAKKRSKILDAVREDLEGEDIDPRDLDEDIDPLADGRQRLSLGDPFRRKSPDEISIDEMLLGMEGTDWYLKLSKETSPNVWQFKRRIDKFRHWADLEFEINMLVQKETLAEIKRRNRVVSWGSGRYMVTFFRDGGLRGDKRKPVFFDIDAQEPEATPATSQASEMMDILRETVQAPKDVIQQNVESMQKGMELAALAGGNSKSGSEQLIALMMNQSNNQTQMMIGLITAMMGAMGKNGDNKDPLELVRGMAGTMKDMGMLPAPGSNNPQSLTDQITIFKTLGLIKDPADSDPFTALTKMKGVLGILQELTGAGPAERPGIMDKLIDAVGPHIGKLIGAIENISAVKAQAAARAPMEAQAERPIYVQAPPPRQIIQAPPAPRPQAPAPAPGMDHLGFPSDAYNANDGSGGLGYDPRSMPDLPPEAYAQAAAQDIAQEISDGQIPVQEAPQVAPQVQQDNTAQLTQELYRSVTSRDYAAFPRVTQMLDSFFGPGIIKQQILAGQMDAKGLVNYVMIFDRSRYSNKQAYLALQDYAQRYIENVRSNSMPIKLVTAVCNTCGARHDFDNRQQWDDEVGETSGHVVCGVNDCQGVLALEI